LFRIKLILVFTILVGLSACNDVSSNQEDIELNSNAISEFGSHVLSNGKVVLEVQNMNNALAYSLDINGERLIEQKPDSSIYSNWLFFWDEEYNRLWFYSGDTGTGFWTRENGNKYNFSELNENSEVLDQTPIIIREQFPRTVRERLWPKEQ